MDRTILHCDCNSFFASVECLFRPELRHVPMAVCGDPESRHGIILAKNDPAKQCGVRTAETIWQARQKCPDLTLTGTRFPEYRKYSRQINEIYQRFTDLVEPFSIDESWLDVTGSLHLFGSGPEIADRLRRTVREETGLTISVGVSFNKIFAKLGSDYKKPDATTVFSRENFRQTVWPLPAGALMFCGKKAARVLESLGVHTIGELAACSRELTGAKLGKLGAQLVDYANGLDSSPVRPFDEKRELKSVGNSVTFRRDISGAEDIQKGIKALSDRVAARMREAGVKCWVVQVGVKDPNLRVLSRQKTLSAPTCLSKELEQAALKLIRSFWNESAPIRLLSLTGSSLVPLDAPDGQLCFFEPGSGAERRKEERLETTLDRIRSRYGTGAVTFGTLLNEDLGLEGLHRK